MKKVMKVSNFIKSSSLRRQDKIRLFKSGLNSYRNYYKTQNFIKNEDFLKYEKERLRDVKRLKRIKIYKQTGDIEKYIKAKNAHKRFLNYAAKNYENMLFEKGGIITVYKNEKSIKFSVLKNVKIDKPKESKYNWKDLNDAQKMKILREANVLDYGDYMLYDARYGDWKRRIKEYVNIDDDETLIQFIKSLA